MFQRQFFSINAAAPAVGDTGNNFSGEIKQIAWRRGWLTRAAISMSRCCGLTRPTRPAAWCC